MVGFTLTPLLISWMVGVGVGAHLNKSDHKWKIGNIITAACHYIEECSLDCYSIEEQRCDCSAMEMENATWSEGKYFLIAVHWHGPIWNIIFIIIGYRLKVQHMNYGKLKKSGLQNHLIPWFNRKSFLIINYFFCTFNSMVRKRFDE